MRVLLDGAGEDRQHLVVHKGRLTTVDIGVSTNEPDRERIRVAEVATDERLAVDLENPDLIVGRVSDEV